MLEPTKKPDMGNTSLSQGIKTGNVDAVRSWLAAGAKPTEEDVDEAEGGEFPEICKELISAGAMDIDRDFGSGGDLLINAVWELKVSWINDIYLHGIALTTQPRPILWNGSSRMEQIPTPVT